MNQEKIGNYISRKRKEKNLTQAQLAECVRSINDKSDVAEDGFPVRKMKKSA